MSTAVQKKYYPTLPNSTYKIFSVVQIKQKFSSQFLSENIPYGNVGSFTIDDFYTHNEKKSYMF